MKRFDLSASTGVATDSAIAITGVGLCVLSLVLTISMPRTWAVLVISLLVHSVSAVTKVYNANTKYYPLISSILVGKLLRFKELNIIEEKELRVNPIFLLFVLHRSRRGLWFYSVSRKRTF